MIEISKFLGVISGLHAYTAIRDPRVFNDCQTLCDLKMSQIPLFETTVKGVEYVIDGNLQTIWIEADSCGNWTIHISFRRCARDQVDARHSRTESSQLS